MKVECFAGKSVISAIKRSFHSSHVSKQVLSLSLLQTLSHSLTKAFCCYLQVMGSVQHFMLDLGLCSVFIFCEYLTKFFSYCQCVSNLRPSKEESVSKLLDRRWTLPNPDAKIHQIMLSTSKVQPQKGRPLSDISFWNNTNPCFSEAMVEKDDSFFIVRDDLLHPLINGNKARKLDALIPLLEDHSVTDVVRI